MSLAAPNINFYHNILKGYTFYYELPKKTHIGGIGVFISNDFSHLERKEFKIPTSDANLVENIWYEIAKNGKKYVIGDIYRDPNQNVQNFTANMDVVLAKLSCQALPCVIAGDLNIDLCKCVLSTTTLLFMRIILCLIISCQLFLYRLV